MPEAMGAGKEFFGSLFAPQEEFGPGGTQWYPVMPACTFNKNGCCADGITVNRPGVPGNCGSGTYNPPYGPGTTCKSLSHNECMSTNQNCQWNPSPIIGAPKSAGTCSQSQPWHLACQDAPHGCCADGITVNRPGVPGNCGSGTYNPPYGPGTTCKSLSHNECMSTNQNCQWNPSPIIGAPKSAGTCSQSQPWHLACQDAPHGCCADGITVNRPGVPGNCGSGTYNPPYGPGTTCKSLSHNECMSTNQNCQWNPSPIIGAPKSAGTCSQSQPWHLACQDAPHGCCADGITVNRPGVPGNCGSGTYNPPYGPGGQQWPVLDLTTQYKCLGQSGLPDAERKYKTALNSYRTCMQTAQHPVT